MPGKDGSAAAGCLERWLTPYHVDRSKIFVHERAEIIGDIDPNRVAAAIEMTRFPIPAEANYQVSDSEGGLVHAADLIGQLADPHYLRKQTALFYEFHEIGVAQKLGYMQPPTSARTIQSSSGKRLSPISATLCAILLSPRRAGSG